MKKKLILKAEGGVPLTNGQKAMASIDAKKEIATEQEKQKILGGFGGTFSTGIMNITGNAMNLANKAIFQNSRYANDPLANTQSEVRTGISDALMKSGNPYAMAAGLVTKIVDGAMDATGIRSDNISKKVAKKADISGPARLANNFANFFPGNPLAAGGPKLNDSFKSEETEQVRGAYSGSLDDIDAAQTMGGGRVNFLLGGARGKINDMIDKANRKNELIAGISRTNTMRKQSDAAMDLNNQNFAKYQGMNYQSMAIGKEGMKLMPKSEVATILKKGGNVKPQPELNVILYDLLYLCTGHEGFQQAGSLLEEKALRKKGMWDVKHEAVDDTYNKDANGVQMKLQAHLNEYSKQIQDAFADTPEALQALHTGDLQTFTLYLADKLGVDLTKIPQVASFQNGGVIGIDTNLLPEGALHKNKNNLEDVNPEIGSEVTEKGIPVISTDENGEIKQVAEIEKEEIILRKEVTTRIEELWKDGSEEAMIEAGKLLAEEIITNTQDNTGQLDNE